MSVLPANTRLAYSPGAAVVEPTTPSALDITHGDRTRSEVTAHQAAQNLRRHAWRAARRVGALLGADVVCFLIARAIIRGMMDGPVDFVARVITSWSPAYGTNELALGVALLVGTTVSGTYGPGDARRHIGRLFVAAAIASVLPLWSRLWTQPSLDAAQAWLLLFAPLFIALVALRMTLDAAALRWSHRSHAELARTLLVGPATDCLARKTGTSLTRRSGFDVLGFLDVGATPHRAALGGVADLETILRERRVDTVVLCGFPGARTMTRVLRAAAVTECTVLASVPQLELSAVRPNVIRQQGQPLLELRPVALRAEQLLVKRAMDLVGAAVILILLAPLLAMIAILIAIDSRGPVFFAHHRLGRFGRPIRCFKFRSMYVDAEARLLGDPVLFRRYVDHGYKLPAAIDTRITRVGRFLRRTSLDELPQLWNVLKGEMSLVGPRPIVPDEIHHYKGEGALFLSLKPGITGAWQVSGRSELAYPQRATVELEYVEGWSLWRDLGILLRTFPAVLAARGAH